MTGCVARPDDRRGNLLAATSLLSIVCVGSLSELTPNARFSVAKEQTRISPNAAKSPRTWPDRDKSCAILNFS